jgi:putative transposase
MGRAPRALDPDGVYHVVCRGSNRQLIVWDEHDCDAFVSELHAIAQKFHWDVYAWCLMPNHHHIILRSNTPAFSAGFQQLNGNHSRRANRRHGRSDHLFRNRPVDRAVESTAHLIGAIAYVVRNPVTAGLVADAGDWPWSSYRATVGREPAPPWLRVDEVLVLFGRDRASAVRAFELLVRTGHLLVSDTEEPLATSE